MSELIEKDPQLASIVDAANSRNLLDDPHPVEAVPLPGGNVTIGMCVENGLEAPVDLTISSDQEWLEPKTRTLSLVGGEKKDCQVIVHFKGKGEFANLCFSWKGANESYQEYVLVWRKSKAEPTASTQGIKPRPPWMPKEV
jgi:hypothetical protein